MADKTIQSGTFNGAAAPDQTRAKPDGISGQMRHRADGAETMAITSTT